MMPLTLVDVDEDNIIKKIGGKPEVKKHLENLGYQESSAGRIPKVMLQQEYDCKNQQ